VKHDGRIKQGSLRVVTLQEHQVNQRTQELFHYEG
jgi:hypothetical protein